MYFSCADLIVSVVPYFFSPYCIILRAGEEGVPDVTK
jgi:hypothetical protein